MKQNKNEEMKRVIAALSGRPRLLLQVCCAPCGSAVLERLSAFCVTPFFYNPNLDTAEEYARRAAQLQKWRIETQPPVICEYDPAPFSAVVRGLEDEPEGGARCRACIALRLQETAKAAQAGGYDFFCSTLSVSPHKDAAFLNETGEQLAARYGVRFLPNDFKKDEGYKRSVQLSRDWALYRQDYCGCAFSRRQRGGQA